MSRRRGGKSKNTKGNNNNNNNNRNNRRVVKPEVKPKADPVPMNFGEVEIGPSLAPGETENFSRVVANNANVAKLVSTAVEAKKSIIEGASKMAAIHSLEESTLVDLNNRWQDMLESELKDAILEEEANLKRGGLKRSLGEMKDNQCLKTLPVEQEIELVELNNKVQNAKNRSEVMKLEHQLEVSKLDKSLSDLNYARNFTEPMNNAIKELEVGSIGWSLINNFKLRGCELVTDGDPEGDDNLDSWDFDVHTYKVEFKGLGFLRLRKNEMVINPTTLESQTVYATADVSLPYYVFTGLNCWEKFWYDVKEKLSCCCCPVMEPGFYLDQTEDWIPLGRLPSASRWFFCPEAFQWMMSKKEDDPGRMAQRYIDYYGFKPTYTAYLIISDTAFIACSLKL